jgi:hypothetical protein
MADDCLLRLVGSISWTPEFVLKRYVLSGIQDAPQEPLIADSIDFVVNQEILELYTEGCHLHSWSHCQEKSWHHA